MASWAHLSIGTATERINLVGRKGAYWVHDWKPTAGPVEDYFSESALADGRQLASYRDLNATESFTLTVRASSQDGAIEATQDLRRMLRKARDYWASAHQPDPVYLAAQASCETYMRYAIVHAGAFPQDSFPFAGTFTRKYPAMTELPFVVERGPWLENAPGTGTLISASAVEAFDGRNLGNVDSAGVRQATSLGTYVANKRNVANLTHIFTWSAANGFSANLMDAALPYDLIDEVGAAPAPADYVCFGIETGAGSVELTDAGPFFSLVFDVATAGAGYSGLWQYPALVGSVVTWTQFWVADNTEQDGAGGGETWDTTGVRSIHWSYPLAWEPTDVNGVTAYWVRYILLQVPGPFTAPVQQNRDVYSIVWPYVDIAANQVGGDMPSLLQLHLQNVSSAQPLITNDPTNAYGLSMDYTMAGLRSYDRGNGFTAYINLSDEQNPAGVTVACYAPDSTFVETDNKAVTGWCVQYAPAGDRTIANEILVTLDDAIIGDFQGTFHLFLRVRQEGGAAGDIGARVYADMAATGGATYQVTKTAYTQTTTYWELLDLGRITIPGAQMTATDVLWNYYLFVQLSNDNAPTATLELSELILMPVDEWAAVIQQPVDGSHTGTSVITYLMYLDADGIQQPKTPIRSIVRQQADNHVVLVYQSHSNGIPILHSGKRQRLWFLFGTTIIGVLGAKPRQSRMETAAKVRLWRQQRYNSMRGSR